MNKPDGGPAFPCDIGSPVKYETREGHTVEVGTYFAPKQVGGMTLRDYFAIKSLESIIVAADNDATRYIPYLNYGGAIDRGSYAQTAYQYADAMLAEREKP